MNQDWYSGIVEFCDHWRHATTLQQTRESLEEAFEAENDGCIDAAKAMVECACRIIVDDLDDPTSPAKPQEANPDFGRWVAAAVQVLDLDEVRDNSFKKLVSQYHRLTTTIGDLRNKAGTLSHGRDGFIAKLSKHQRRTALLAADAIVTFLHEAYLERGPELIRTREPYDRFMRTNELIDRYVGITAQEDDEEALIRIEVVLPNDDLITLSVEASRLLFEIDREAYISALNAAREADAVAPADKASHDE